MVGRLSVYLVDTNIILELLLEQEKAKDVFTFLHKTDSSLIYITEFSLYSIGIALLRLNKTKLFIKWINLDFDDAYQYAVAEKYNLQIISFDKDFDRTEKGRKEPAEIIY